MAADAALEVAQDIHPAVRVPVDRKGVGVLLDALGLHRVVVAHEEGVGDLRRDAAGECLADGPVACVVGWT